MSDAVERVARVILDRQLIALERSVNRPRSKSIDLPDQIMDHARALLAEITPLLVADAVKAERENTLADLFKPMQDAMDVLSKASKWGYGAPLSFCRAFGSVKAAHFRSVERAAAIRARGGEG